MEDLVPCLLVTFLTSSPETKARVQSEDVHNHEYFDFRLPSSFRSVPTGWQEGRWKFFKWI